MKKIITTLPIKPQTHPKTGLYLTPLFLEVVANLNEGESVLMLNLLHSFKDYSIHKQNYLDSLRQANLKFNSISSDVDNLDKYNKIIKELYEQGLINKSKIHVYKCNCGKVEISDELITHITNKKLIKENEDGMICSLCHTPLEKKEIKCLELLCNNALSGELEIFPKFLEKRTISSLKDFNNTSLIISKNRDTGMTITLDGEDFYIDIDFLLYLTPQLFDEKDITLVCCNRHTMHVLLTNYINQIYGHKNLQFVEHPYIISKNPQDTYDNLTQCSNHNLLKASLLNSISWNNLDSTWNEGRFQYLKKNNDILEEILSYNNLLFRNKSLSIGDRITKYCSIIDRIRDRKSCKNEQEKN